MSVDAILLDTYDALHSWNALPVSCNCQKSVLRARRRNFLVGKTERQAGDAVSCCVPAGLPLALEALYGSSSVGHSYIATTSPEFFLV
jgi:hypothetical protein